MNNKTITALAAACLLSFSSAGFAEDVPKTTTAVVGENVTVEPAAPADPTELDFSNKWRIKFDNRTDTAGELVFLFALKDQTPINVSVTVAKNQSENDIAKLVESALKKTAPAGIMVERDDGEDVLVKFKDRFSLSILTNTVSDLDIKLEKE
ncbi:MAG: hypothetical protein ABI644_02500 [Arenimonas sp.]